jgi:hypothetical protein
MFDLLQREEVGGRRGAALVTLVRRAGGFTCKKE